MQDTTCMYTEYFSSLKSTIVEKEHVNLSLLLVYPSWVNGISIKQTIWHLKLRSFLFDESLNDISQTCEMDVLIRFFDSSDNQVRVR